MFYVDTIQWSCNKQMLVLTIQVTLKALITKYQWNTARTQFFFVRTITRVKFFQLEGKKLLYAQLFREKTHFQA